MPKPADNSRQASFVYFKNVKDDDDILIDTENGKSIQSILLNLTRKIKVTIVKTFQQKLTIVWLDTQALS